MLYFRPGTWHSGGVRGSRGCPNETQTRTGTSLYCLSCLLHFILCSSLYLRKDTSSKLYLSACFLYFMLYPSLYPVQHDTLYMGVNTLILRLLMRTLFYAIALAIICKFAHIPHRIMKVSINRAPAEATRCLVWCCTEMPPVDWVCNVLSFIHGVVPSYSDTLD